MDRNKKKWMVQNKGADFYGLAKALSLDPVTVRILRNRGLTTKEEMEHFLNADTDTLYNPFLMKGMKEGIALVKSMLECQAPIRVIGDYDADGITSTYILYRVLTEMGGRVSVAIPHRVRDGYGLNANLIHQCKADGISLVITCDNGVSSIEALLLAKEYGIHAIITDHHRMPCSIDEKGNEVEEEIPADVVINPKQKGCTYPFKELCGAGVAFKFAMALMEVENPELKKELLMYAAIGTIGDVMDLIGENRVLVKAGLHYLHETEDNSLLALIEKCGLQQKRISSGNIGFQIAPCLNASGRMDSAFQALELLLHKDKKDCETQAEKLVSMNEERKLLTEKYVHSAVQMMENCEDKVLVVYLPECHESIAGIVAGRIRERFYKPTLVITKGEEFCKGSGRSIEGYCMYDELKKAEDCFIKFGGHSMAVGFSIEEERIDELRCRLNQECKLTEADLIEKIIIDVPMPMDYVTVKLLEEFRQLEPFGKGNPSPLFAQKDLELLHISVVGRERKFVKLSLLTPAGSKVTGVYFVAPEEVKAYIRETYGEEIAEGCMEGKRTGVKLSVCYQPEINEYQGRKNVQYLIKHIM